MVMLRRLVLRDWNRAGRGWWFSSPLSIKTDKREQPDWLLANRIAEILATILQSALDG